MITALYLISFCLIVLVLLLLFLPVRLHLILDEKKRVISLGWLFMMLGTDLVSKTFELRLFSQRIISLRFRKKTKEKDEVKKVKKGKKKGRGFDVIKLWKEKDLLTQVFFIFFLFLKDILRSIRVNRFWVDADIATPDPALTGVIYGGLYALSYPTNFVSPHIRIKIRPDFENDIPRGKGEVAFTTRLINTIGAILRMFFALPKIRIIKIFLKRKKEVNKNVNDSRTDPEDHP
jgi:hypothetical protein